MTDPRGPYNHVAPMTSRDGHIRLYRVFRFMCTVFSVERGSLLAMRR